MCHSRQIALAALLLATVVSVYSDLYNFGVDICGTVSKKQFQCMQRNGYKLAFIEIYNFKNTGIIDSEAANNVMNALDANLAVEVYVQPDPTSSQSGATQFREAYKYLQNNKISIETIWLLVTYPISWSLNPNANVNFIHSFLQEARKSNLYVGIYTNWYDWYLITNNYQKISSDGNVMLWYWNTLGVGPTAESIADFSEFRPFGGWSAPFAKQFAIEEQVCGVKVGREVYKSDLDSPVSMRALFSQNNATVNSTEKIRVG